MLAHLSDALTNHLLDIVLPPLVSAIAALLVAVLAKQLQKIGLQVTAEQTQQMKTTVKDAILAVEESARGQRLPADAKLAAATAIAQSHLPNVDPDHLAYQINATLPTVREELSKLPKPSTPGTFGR
jgi:hypothetical protein